MSVRQWPRLPTAELIQQSAPLKANLLCNFTT